RGGAGAAGPRGDEGRRLRRRGRRRSRARGPEGDAAARGALGLRPRRQGGAHRPHRAPALVAHAAQGLPGGDRAREDRPDLHAAGDALPGRGRDRPYPEAAAGAARRRVPARLGPGRVDAPRVRLERGKGEARSQQLPRDRGGERGRRGRRREPGRLGAAPGPPGGLGVGERGMTQRLLLALRDRRWRAAAAAALVLLAIVGAGFVRRVVPDGVATVRVSPGRFVREVEARGSLKAVKATPILVPPELGRQQKVAFLAKDGAFVKAGETVVEFDPYDAEREAADGKADLTAAQARIEKARAEGTKNEASLGLDKDVAKEQLDGAETFRLTDESLYSRHQIIESQLDRDLFKAKAEVAEKK